MKTILLASALGLTTVLQAATISWSAEGYLYNGDYPDPILVTSRPIAYLMTAAESFDQYSLVEKFAHGCLEHASIQDCMEFSDGWVGTGGRVDTSAQLQGLSTDTSTEIAEPVYAVVLYWRKMFISPEATIQQNLEGALASIGSITDVSQYTFDATQGYVGPGWYGFGDEVTHFDPRVIPEPTSALLLLVGFAGVFLRRPQRQPRNP